MMNPNATLFSSFAIAMEAGVLLGAAYVLTRRLWLAVGIHFAWNFTQGGIFGGRVSGITMDGLLESQLSGPTLFSGGSSGWRRRSSRWCWGGDGGLVPGEGRTQGALHRAVLEEGVDGDAAPYDCRTRYVRPPVASSPRRRRTSDRSQHRRKWFRSWPTRICPVSVRRPSPLRNRCASPNFQRNPGLLTL